jgi:AAHS family 3-hydroxyphenylpropionic acid transporter
MATGELPQSLLSDAVSRRSPAWATLTLCSASALLEGFDNQSMGVAAPRVIAEFALSPGQAGLIFSAATLGLFVGAAVGGRVADFVGRKRALAVSLLLFGLCSLLTAMAVGPESLFAARVLTGLGLGGAMPNFISLASESAPANRRLSAVTVVMAGMPFGGALAGLMALGAQLGWAWRAIFLVGGAAPLLLAGLIWRVLPEAHETRLDVARRDAVRRDSIALDPSSRDPALGDPVRRDAVKRDAVKVASARSILFGADRAATTLCLWCGFFFTQLVLLLMLNWLPTLMIGLGFTRSQASLASICFNVSGGLGAIVLGRLHAGRHRRPWVVVTYAGMGTALAGVSAVGTDFKIAAVACALAGAFIVGAQLILFALAPLYYSFSMRGTGVGAAVAMGRLGSVVGPLFAGALLATGSASTTVLLAILPFVVVGGTAALALTWRRGAEE